GDMYDTGKKMSEVNKNLDFLGILINMREDDIDILDDLNEKYNIINEEMFFQSYILKRKRIDKYAKTGLFSINSKSYIQYTRWYAELSDTYNDMTNELIKKISESDNE